MRAFYSQVGLDIYNTIVTETVAQLPRDEDVTIVNDQAIPLEIVLWEFFHIKKSWRVARPAPTNAQRKDVTLCSGRVASSPVSRRGEDGRSWRLVLWERTLKG